MELWLPESPSLLAALDWVFHGLHIATILINTTFWLCRRTLWLNQLVILLTLLSWLAFGAKYGWGYCFPTDWHWQVKEALGQRDLPYSYVKYVLDRVTGLDIPPYPIDVGVTIVLVFSVLACAIQTCRHGLFRLPRRQRRPG